MLHVIVKIMWSLEYKSRLQYKFHFGFVINNNFDRFQNVSHTTKFVPFYKTITRRQNIWKFSHTYTSLYPPSLATYGSFSYAGYWFSLHSSPFPFYYTSGGKWWRRFMARLFYYCVCVSVIKVFHIYFYFFSLHFHLLCLCFFLLSGFLWIFHLGKTFDEPKLQVNYKICSADLITLEHAFFVNMFLCLLVFFVVLWFYILFVTFNWKLKT